MRRREFRLRTSVVVAGALAVAAAVAVPTVSSMQHAGERLGSASTASTGTVKTDSGWLRGISTTNYTEYLGIPYAAPPVGALRFMPPQRVPHWSGTRDATAFGNRCVQGSGWDPGYENPILTEDCLYLNVYVPSHVRDGGPVLAWIHGGGFTGGAGQDTDPRKYVDQTGAIYVTINYRLGALGYLDLPQLRAAGDGGGNNGLLDQQAALRWVHDNISAFGGNPQNVSIAGQSAGGSSVCDQVSSPTAKGLFQRAVIMSGGCSMTSQSAADAAGQAFATTLGCPDAATVLACIRSKSTADILHAQQTASLPVRPAVGGNSFPLDPATAVATGQFNRVPVMNGQVHDERRLFVFQGNDYLGHPVTADSYEATIRATYGADADQILAAYPVTHYPTPGIALATVQSDAASETRYALDKQFAKWVPTHAYEFAEEDTPQFYSIYRLQQAGDPAASFNFGATHVDDLGYLWEYLGHALPYSDDELQLSDQMITFWSQFQRTGDPNANKVPTWPAFTQSGGDWMELRACNTSEAGNQPPAACSAASDNYLTDHKLALWSGVPG
jgi:para-nitrobenzyl esterase